MYYKIDITCNIKL